MCIENALILAETDSKTKQVGNKWVMDAIILYSIYVFSDCEKIFFTKMLSSFKNSVISSRLKECILRSAIFRLTINFNFPNNLNVIDNFLWHRKRRNWLLFLYFSLLAIVYSFHKHSSCKHVTKLSKSFLKTWPYSEKAIFKKKVSLNLHLVKQNNKHTYVL